MDSAGVATHSTPVITLELRTYPVRPPSDCYPSNAATPESQRLDKRIIGPNPRKPTEISICGPQLADAVEPADRGDAGVVDAGTGNAAGFEKPAELGPVAVGLAQEREARGFEPGVHLPERGGERRGGLVDPGVRDDGEELVDAGPRDRPRGLAFGEGLEPRDGLVVPLRVLAVRVDEQVAVDRDRAPRPCGPRRTGRPRCRSWSSFGHPYHRSQTSVDFHNLPQGSARHGRIEHPPD